MSEPDVSRLYSEIKDLYDEIKDLVKVVNDLRVALVEATTKLAGLPIDKHDSRITHLEKRDETLGWKILLAVMSAVGAVAMALFQFFLSKGGK